ncbi:hypothetical protein [Paenibacillus macerans]|uniref:hypothetical protein n=1 Tax=Paenibacillus macerans TaxID=44252 RepID=UPI00203BC73E|nr:hypothetical protein [Paenibacillus macerans]MCM3699372.1 hypothetical protein [Paenibacillus macerans]
MINHLILPAGPPRISQKDAVRIRQDYERFSETGLPERVELYLLEQYGLDVSSVYGPRPIKNPFGKASGQLSLSAHQVQSDAEAGLGFVVLKTVIAEDEQGDRSMKEWAVKETRMEVGRIVGKETGEPGWNVTWHGRGWHGSFNEYLSFVREAIQLGRERGTVVVPSCKYHLPAIGEDFRLDEYRYTTRRLAQVWEESGEAGPLQLEKDFSPTLAGSDRAAERPAIIRWLREVPKAIRLALPDGDIRLGIKLMNTLFDDEFQLRTIRTLVEEGDKGADYIVYANRLYDSGRQAAGGGNAGAAYGGPDLSVRNLRILSWLRRLELEGELPSPVPVLSGTGNVHSGKMALEYALRGVSSLQMHTLFQLPGDAYSMKRGSRTQRALHELFFHPDVGLVAWMLHLRETGEIAGRGGTASFREVTNWYRDRGRAFFLE